MLTHYYRKTGQFCSQIEQNMSNLFQLQHEGTKTQNSVYSVHTPTQLRKLSVREKFAPLRTLGQASAGTIVFNHIPFKIGGGLPSNQSSNH